VWNGNFDGNSEEYEGASYVSNYNSRKKKLLGDLCKQKSSGNRLFLMAEKNIF
jgi:hypothetical protein